MIEPNSTYLTLYIDLSIAPGAEDIYSEVGFTGPAHATYDDVLT
ncbi:hypothetical protein PHO31112_03281 [Pandoraea horticolens]|uniref:Uncharacterized protein n=1 Tax=Pandoraea horticolens TaxID=2508298 RepID=A0A5E4WGM6_9BURK|nr:hypothetical protein PHO31112_03281 [Pandoraea horticolens]